MTTTTPRLRRHQWAETGVSGYPLAHPIVGQTRFYETFRHFIHLVDRGERRFAHVFALIAQWGIGKSRLGYELIAQINGTSPGWYVRDDVGQLTRAELFENDGERDRYLGLYIRYSQIANDYHNIDNWFGFGLYKALLPLAAGRFDDSIQGRVAREAYDRLLVRGFDEKSLAAALEVAAKHTDEKLYTDPILVTRLCQAGYDYLRGFGVENVLIVLDELETAAETSTYGLEMEDIKRLDGRAIKLVGKAIKEEDPRQKLPWLRYVALCSPAIGDELKAIESINRRFEMVEIAANVFADVSDFVRRLESDGRLDGAYPPGLVEAAYAMSGGNFGWFNVIMANVDEILRRSSGRRGGEAATVGAVFDEAVQVSPRIRNHVLDRQAIQELKLDRAFLPAAKEMLYGQLPVPLTALADDTRRALLAARNEYDEPVAVLFQRVEWEERACGNALRAGKFVRGRDGWRLGGVDQPLDLPQLLANLGTYAIHAGGGVSSGDRHTLLIPLRVKDFVELVALLYPHPAAEDAARALWRDQIGGDELAAGQATHVGPSIAMLGRLDLRYRRQSHNSLIFRDPDESAAHERAMAGCKGQSDEDKTRMVLTGVLRALDENWGYDPRDAGLKGDGVALVTTSGRGRGSRGAVPTCEALHLHPDGRVVLAWVRNLEELEDLCDRATSQFATEGRTPVLAFTSSRVLVDQFGNPPSPKVRDAREYLLLYQVSSSEEFVLHQVGLPTAKCQGFALNGQRFTTAFANRLQSLVRPLKEEIHRWRRQLNDLGRVAWPMRSSGPLRAEELAALTRAWRDLMLATPEPRPVGQLDVAAGRGEVLAVLEKTGITPKARAAGYLEGERVGLFGGTDEAAEPLFPAFLVQILERLLAGDAWTFAAAEREWFWGYVWEGIRPRDTYQAWMHLACEIGFAREVAAERRSAESSYRLVEAAELRGALAEAANWLEQEYPAVVTRMEAVFGAGKVLDYFGPLGGTKVGTKTRKARGDLETARQELEALVVEEGSRDRSRPTADRAALHRACARRRLLARDAVAAVFDRDGYDGLRPEENLKTLNFEDDAVPLWERVGRARLFSEFVLRAKDQIVARVGWAQEALRAEAEPIRGFPVQLFTRCLHKVQDILEGALTLTAPAGSTQRLQNTEPGTLGFYLRELKIAEATRKLDELAAEVGLDFHGTAPRDLPDVEGQVVRGFFDLKRAFELEAKRLVELRGRLEVLAEVLHDPPTEPAAFHYPPSAPALAELLRRPDLIQGELEESVHDDIEGLITQHDAAAKLGQFQPLIHGARNLLQGPRTGLGTLAGHVLTLENAVQDYRRRLLEVPDLRAIERAMNALLATRNQPPRKPLELPDIVAAGPLRRGAELLHERRTSWVTEGDGILASTGVSFGQWQDVVKALEAGRDPDLPADTAERLVAGGFLRRTYTLGGPSR